MSSHHHHCLSAEPHINNIKEYLLHFLGCVEISERSRFLNDELHDVWLFETQHHIDSGKSEDEARVASKEKREKWKTGCLSELRRIRFLRTRLEDDDEGKRLVSNLEDSSKEWRNSDEYKRGIETVRKWKCSSQYNSYRQERTKEWENSDEYKKCIRLAGKLKSRPGYTESSELNKDLTDIDPKPEWKHYITERDVNVPIIKFQGGESRNFEFKDIDNGKVWGLFPDQKTTVEHLLDETTGKENILYREKADSTTIKYFHLPSNNMDVSAMSLFIPFKKVADSLISSSGQRYVQWSIGTCDDG